MIHHTNYSLPPQICRLVPLHLRPSAPTMAFVTFSPITASCSSSSSLLSTVSAGQNWVRLPEFRGLKVRPRNVARSIGSIRTSPSSRVSRGARIVCEAQDTAVDVASVTDATWKSLVLESDLPVLVEFWAPWCGPCRMIHPVIDELSKQYAGKLKCLKVNTDDSPSIATQYGIRSIPTVIIFKNGEKKDAVIGAVPKSTLTTSIEKFL